MRNWTARFVAPAVLVAGFMAPVVQAQPASAASVVKRALSPNAPKLKLAFDAGQHAEVTFSGLDNETVRVKTSSGSYADNCDVSVTVKKGGATVKGPLCGGQSSDTGTIKLPSDATYTIIIDPGASPAGSLKLALTSSGPKKSITPNAEAVTVASNAGSSTDYGFIGTAGQRLSATSSGNVIETCNVHMSIIAPDGTTVVGTAPCAGSVGFIDAIDNLGAGTYKLRIENSGAVNGSIALSLFQFTDVNAPIAPDGVEVIATSKFPGQRLLYTFTGAVGQKVSYRISGSDINSGETHWQRPDGSSTGGTCISTNCFQDATTLDMAGTWAIVVDPSGTQTGLVEVQLFTFTDVDGGTITANGAAATLFIDTPGQNGFFSFSGAFSQQVSFQVTVSSINVGSVYLVRPNGTSFGGTCILKDCFQDSIKLDVAGTWKIFVDPSGSNGGQISIKLYTFTDIAGGLITPNGAGAPMTITTPGQNGSFIFTGAVGQKVAFFLTDSTIPSGSVFLRRPSNGASFGGTCITKGCFQDSITLDEAGTWKLQIDPGGVSTGSITIELYTFTDVNGGALTQGGAAKTVTTTAPGQIGFFTFTGSVGQMAGFEVTQSTVRIGSVYFQRPDGTTVGGACIRKNCTQAALTLDAAGVWKIVVDPGALAHGTVGVKLT